MESTAQWRLILVIMHCPDLLRRAMTQMEVVMVAHNQVAQDSDHVGPTEMHIDMSMGMQIGIWKSHQ